MPRNVAVEGGRHSFDFRQIGQDEHGKWQFPDEYGPPVIAQGVLALSRFRKRILPNDPDHMQTRRVQIIFGGSYFDANSTGAQLLEKLKRAQHPDGQPYLYLDSKPVQSILAPETMPRQLSTVRKRGASLRDLGETDPWIEPQLPISTQVSIALVGAGLIPFPEEVTEASLKKLLEINPYKLEVLASGGFGSNLDQEYKDLLHLLNTICQLP